MLANLGQVGVQVDSEVGGTGNRAERALTEVSFWGILDVKYDPRLPEKDRVRVLELGDGRTSRFSHHGRHIKQRFEREYSMAATPIKRAVMVENKKFTHDMFVREGFKHLRPPCVCFPRRYTPSLAFDIAKALAVSGENAVVLKLCNRSRGAGVLVVRACDLDGVLFRLLMPPEGSLLRDWLERRSSTALDQRFDDWIEEHCLHWWSNECPIFMAELCCHSVGVEMEPGSGLFDGTMRVAFALYRKKASMTEVRPFDIDWLGGYWKLPRDPMQGAVCHDQVVSSFNSAEKRTAEVSEADLQVVYDALAPALPQIFHTGALSVSMVNSFYSNEKLFRAYALSRIACGLRHTDMAKSKGLLDLAQRMLPRSSSFDAEDVPERSVLSYIERNMGVCSAMLRNWSKASDSFRASLSTLLTNATSHYLEGCSLLEGHCFDLAAASFLRAIALDPDFMSPYVALGSCRLHQGKFHEAIDASITCLRRHPDTPVAQFNVGQALYHLFRLGTIEVTEREGLLEKGRAALDLAKRRAPSHWADVDQRMLDYFEEEDEVERESLPRETVHIWRTLGWRP